MATKPKIGERIVIPRDRIERAHALIRKGLTGLAEVQVKIDAARGKTDG